ncbi:hypothetical protein ACFSCX_06175 [Bacillus salitolerans]|uniref:Uncharacterized protein n=1 Tax=Bacillus salitolerans TaxID=1437434 RepID=A0ABW4LN76_9BACI
MEQYLHETDIEVLKQSWRNATAMIDKIYLVQKDKHNAFIWWELKAKVEQRIEHLVSEDLKQLETCEYCQKRKTRWEMKHFLSTAWYCDDCYTTMLRDQN